MNLQLLEFIYSTLISNSTVIWTKRVMALLRPIDISRRRNAHYPSHHPITSRKVPKQDAKNTVSPQYGTFMPLRIFICTSHGAICIQKESENGCIKSLNGPLRDPSCRVCTAKTQHSTWIGQRIASHFQGHSVLCMELERDRSYRVKQYVQSELEKLAEEVKAKERLMQRIGRNIEVISRILILDTVHWRMDSQTSREHTSSTRYPDHFQNRHFIASCDSWSWT